MSFNDYWQAEQRRKALREAMVSVRNRDEGAVHRLQSTLRAAVLLVPVREVPANHDVGDTVRGANVPLQVMLSRDEQGGQHLVVFTSEQELGATFPAAPPFIGLSFNVLAHLAAQAPVTDVIIDRNGPNPVTIPPSLLIEWARPTGAASAAAPEGAKTPPGQQAQLTPPPRLVTWRELQTLEQILQSQEGLVQAYVFGVMHGKPPPLLTVGLGFTTQPAPDVLQSLAREVGRVLGPSGVLALDSRLPLLLSRQPGTIRFDLEPRGSPPLVQGGDRPTPDGSPPAPLLPE